MARKPPGGVSPGKNISREAAKLINQKVRERAEGRANPDHVTRPGDLVDWARKEFPGAYADPKATAQVFGKPGAAKKK